MILTYNFDMSDDFETDSEGTIDLRKTLSNNIRIFRKELHLTQEQLAENAEISFPSIATVSCVFFLAMSVKTVDSLTF